jgi:ethanolamine ammonia-lyase small subunit
VTEQRITGPVGSPQPQGLDDDHFWSGLRRLTTARIGLPRAGASLATRALLDFRLAHARARDAVLELLDEPKLVADVKSLGDVPLTVTSAAPDRQTYLVRPDFGRRLAPGAAATLAQHRGTFDVGFVIADGLSAGAVQAHAVPVLARVTAMLRAEGWRIAPTVIVRGGRVAIGDAIANALGAASIATLIGERPGLSAPDSMGAYLTWRPGPTTTDADRNCISNIRPNGLPYEAAAAKAVHLLRAMRARQLSGVRLKDDSAQSTMIDAQP